MDTSPKPYVLIDLNRLKQLINIEKEFQSQKVINDNNSSKNAENSEGYGIMKEKSNPKNEFSLENTLHEQSQNIESKNYPNEINDDENVKPVTKNMIKEAVHFPVKKDSITKNVVELQKELYNPFSLLNKTDKSKAQKLLNNIKKLLPSNVFSYNDDGNISINLETLRESNLAEILKQFYKPTSKEVPGFIEFKTLLKNYKISSKYDSNTKVNIKKRKADSNLEDIPIITYFKLNMNE